MMPLNLTEKTFIHEFWFMHWNGGDLMGYVVDCPDEGLHGEYRWRYYADDRTDRLSKDRKSWYRITPKQGVQLADMARHLCDAMHQLVCFSAMGKRGEVFHKVLNCYGLDAIEQLKDLPFFHMEKIEAN